MISKSPTFCSGVGRQMAKQDLQQRATQNKTKVHHESSE